MKCTISTWLHKFAQVAEKAIAAELLHQGFNMDVAKAEFVQFLLGDPKDLSSKNCPFIWEFVYDDANAKRQVTFIYINVMVSIMKVSQAIFQGWLVAQTFLDHIIAISGVPKEYHVQEWLVGALILSIQVVRPQPHPTIVVWLILLSGTSHASIFSDRQL